jgi:hypothetical protein
MTKRYLGNIITQSPTPPAGPYQDSAASGVWSLAEALSYTKGGLWPTAGNLGPLALFTTGSSDIEQASIITLGNATDFGDILQSGYSEQGPMCTSSITRGIFAGGGSGGTNVISYVTFAAAGNAVDFGDLRYAWGYGGRGNISNGTRGCFAGGNNANSTYSALIDFVTIATTGNSTSFGNLTVGRNGNGQACSPTRGLIFGGTTGSPTNVIDYITIASTGNALDFGDLGSTYNQTGGCSSSTRALRAGAFVTSNVIEYMSIGTTGNATDFGDLTVGRRNAVGASSETRALFGGGNNQNIIDYVTISTTGNAADFGDLSETTNYGGGCSNAHGGLAA